MEIIKTTNPKGYRHDKLTGFYDRRCVTVRRDLLVPRVPSCGEYDYEDSVTVRLVPVYDEDRRRIGYEVIVFANGVIINHSGKSDEFRSLRMAKLYAKHLLDQPRIQHLAQLVLFGEVDDLSSFQVRRIDYDASGLALDEFYGT